MYRKALIILMALMMTAGLAGCGKKQPVEPDPPVVDPEPSKPAEATVIIDKNGKKLGEIKGEFTATAADKGIFYSSLSFSQGQPTVDVQYHFFNMEDGTDAVLGELKQQGYEGAYNRLERDGIIYTLVLQGDPFDGKNDTLYLLVFDPVGKTMSKYVISEQGFAYAFMAETDGKILIMNHETDQQKSDKIYEFDMETASVKEVLSFDSSKDSLRALCGSSDGFYLLKLDLSKDQPELMMDIYDSEYRKISQYPLSEVIIEAMVASGAMVDRQDALADLGNSVSRFIVVDETYLYYENFGITRAVIDLNKEKAVQVFDDTYFISLASGSPVICRMGFDIQSDAVPEILELSEGEMKRHSFKPTDSHILIQNASVSENGTKLLVLSDNYPLSRATAAVYLWKGSWDN